MADRGVVPAQPGWWFVSRDHGMDGTPEAGAAWVPIVAWIVGDELLAVTTDPELGWENQEGPNRFVLRPEGPLDTWPFPD